jgi:glycosyltransferase involved in cell wall biosynthesis
MKILQINKYHFIRGGSDRVYFNTSKLLEDNQHEIIHFSSDDPNNVNSRFSKYFVKLIDNRKNSSFSKIKSAGEYLYNKKAYNCLNELIDLYQPDIAHLHLFYGGLSSSILKSLRNKGIPVLHTVHDYRLICPASLFLDSKNRICEKCKNRSYYQCSVKRCLEGNFFYSSMLAIEAYYRKYLFDPLEYIDHFIFVSRFAKEKHIEFDNRFRDKSSHLYNFTDIPSHFSTSDKDNYLLFLGRLSREKGVTTLLKAAEENNLRLKIAGTGPIEPEVIKFSKRNLNIEYLGHQSGPGLTELIKGSSFIIIPSEWYENNPMTVIEAYAHGIPVIGARIGGIPEIVIDKETGFLFESGNPEDLSRTILRAKQLSPSEYLNMSVNARTFAEQNFSSVIHYNKLMEIYSKVLPNDWNKK